MSIFEYNEAEEKEKIRKAEYEGGFKDGIRQGIEQGMKQGIKTGIEQGIEQTLFSLIQKKLQKGKTIAQIADELEVEPAEIERILREHGVK